MSDITKAYDPSEPMTAEEREVFLVRLVGTSQSPYGLDFLEKSIDWSEWMTVDIQRAINQRRRELGAKGEAAA
jgi:hypothetical protein